MILISMNIDINIICLTQRRVGSCRACYACSGGGCPIDDDVPYIIDRMYEANAIVMVIPVYFYSVD